MVYSDGDRVPSINIIYIYTLMEQKMNGAGIGDVYVG